MDIKEKPKAVVIKETPADENHQVLTITGGKGTYRKKPCSDCPWRVDSVGEFPAEAFVISAHTAYDMATETFGCHQSGKVKPATCAGFLMNGAYHNLSVRMKRSMGKIVDDITDDGLKLFQSYREMAEANGVDPEHPRLKNCRD